MQKEQNYIRLDTTFNGKSNKQQVYLKIFVITIKRMVEERSMLKIFNYYYQTNM